MATTTTMVDIIASVAPDGGFKKISDYNALSSNNRVSTLLNLLYFYEGNNSLYPDMGILNELCSINYNESKDISSILNAISTKASKFLNFQVSFDYEYKDATKEEIVIKITVEGLPGTIKFDTVKNGAVVKLINPKYVK